MRKARVLVSALLPVLFLVACAPVVAPAPVPGPAAASAPAPGLPASVPAPAAAAVAVKPAWEIEWEKTVQVAKTDRRVVMLSSTGTTVRYALVGTFKSKFDISLEPVSATSTELGVKVVNERRAGLYTSDVGIVGYQTPSTILKPAAALEHLEPVLFLPELTALHEIQKVWRFGLEWVDKGRTILSFGTYLSPGIVVNTQLVKPGDIQGFRDLLDPQWKGKIVINDPTRAEGAGGTWARVVGTEILDWDYMRKLVQQELVITRDERQQMEWVARGKFAIAIAPKAGVVTEFVAAGAPVSLLRAQEGSHTTPGANAITLMKNAPNPNAAKLFINWLLSKEGQSVYSKANRTPSSRMDVSTEGVDPAYIPDPKKKNISTATEEFMVKQPAAQKMVEEIFGALKK